MIAKKIEGGYQLESPTINGVFVVKLTLTDEGKETIETCSSAVVVCSPIQELDRGTIERTIGPARWQLLGEMKEKGIAQMFIDPQDDARRVKASRSW
jgi:hypothetical protein